MTIAIDYDDTYTVDPELWRNFAELATRRGHTIICITARRKTLDNQQELARELPSCIAAYFSYDEPKSDYARRNNIAVDVWIDDDHGACIQVGPDADPLRGPHRLKSSGKPPRFLVGPHQRRHVRLL